MLQDRIRIDDKITYWKAAEEPLSADVGVIEGNNYTWLYDVGSSEEVAKAFKACRSLRK